MTLPRRQFLPFAAAAALPASSLIARAEGYPTRPVRIIVPFAAGGASDVAGRSSQKLTEAFGKQVQAGSGGNLGMGSAARAAADGYTILLVTPSFVVNSSLLKNKVPRMA
jgi:tripartite-type tricarboxylate transporter receptor subunit TctC